jgi:geranylgeranyl reductase family protein
MQNKTVIIVGGGPGGSTCAWRLKQANIDCLVLDQQVFPRFKPCAGWITPGVLRDLGLNPVDYPFSFTTFTSFHISLRGIKIRLPARQHAIRRYEFDDWLLKRAGAPVLQHTVKDITQTEDGFVIDGEFTAKFLVGAGGTHCPVYRSLFQASNPHPKAARITAMEEEFPYTYRDPHCRLWFLEDGLPGYAWYVPKANGIVNVGVGGQAEVLKAHGDTLKKHWNKLVEKLERMDLVRGHSYKPSGHSYYLRQRQPELRRGNAFLVGDAAGLASMDMGEGIGPAIQSGRLAAESILTGGIYRVDAIPRYSLSSLLRMGWA